MSEDTVPTARIFVPISDIPLSASLVSGFAVLISAILIRTTIRNPNRVSSWKCIDDIILLVSLLAHQTIKIILINIKDTAIQIATIAVQSSGRSPLPCDVIIPPIDLRSSSGITHIKIIVNNVVSVSRHPERIISQLGVVVGVNHALIRVKDRSSASFFSYIIEPTFRPTASVSISTHFPIEYITDFATILLGQLEEELSLCQPCASARSGKVISKHLTAMLESDVNIFFIVGIIKISTLRRLNDDNLNLWMFGQHLIQVHLSLALVIADVNAVHHNLSHITPSLSHRKAR